MQRLFLFFGTIGGLVAVALGAIGAHALQGRVEQGLLDAYGTAVDYQFVHALALVAIGIGREQLVRCVWIKIAGWLLLCGTALFSGSLYILVAAGLPFVAWITPLGGICLILGWTAFAVGALRCRDT